MSGTSPDVPFGGGEPPAAVTTLLDRTTPIDVPPIDLDDVARRSRRRRHRRRGGSAATAALAMALVVTAAVTVGSIGEPDGDGTAAVGGWSPVAAPPFAPRASAFAGTLDDGRMLIWGGEAGTVVEEEGGGTTSQMEGPARLDGGIFDPRTGEWTTIPDAPLRTPFRWAGGQMPTSVSLRDDRLAVVTANPSTDGKSIDAAVYDVAEGRWYSAPPQDQIRVQYDGVAWDGEVLAVVRVSHGDVGVASDPSSDWRTDRPVTLRWSPGQADWREGAAPPFGLRHGAGVAFDGARLAVWGGTTASPYDDTGPVEGATADGGIYDVATDAWQIVPPGPLTPRILASVAWFDGRLVVGGGFDHDTVDASNQLADLAAYDSVTGTWESLAGPPSGIVGPFDNDDVVSGIAPLLVLGTRDIETGPPRRWALGRDGWEQVHSSDIHALGGMVVATTATDGLPGTGSFGLRIRTGPDQWRDGAEVAFANRQGAAIAANENSLLVVGGYQGDEYDLQNDAWLFHLSD